MIFYTLSGPKYNLEIHDDKIKLQRRIWWKLVSREPTITCWELHNLSTFAMTPGGFMFLGKIEWQSNNGHKGAFRFSTNADMVKKSSAICRSGLPRIKSRRSICWPLVLK